MWVDNHSHAHIIHQHIRDCLAEAFPPVAHVPKKPYVDDECMSMIGSKGQLLKRLRETGKQCSYECARYCLKAWH
eukprot:11628795-Karenia_brevis.AAC.1